MQTDRGELATAGKKLATAARDLGILAKELRSFLEGT